jgi:hypothetical protein
VALLAGACRAGNELPGPISPEEYAIYGVLADSLYAGNKDSVTDLVTEDSTARNYYHAVVRGRDRQGNWKTYGELDGLARICADWKAEDHEALMAAYAQANSAPSPFCAESIKTSLRRIAIGRDSLRSIWKNGSWNGSWARFYAAFPRSNGVIRYSRVGFDAGRTQGVVFVEVMRGELDGFGCYFFMQQIEGRWRLKCRSQDWVS